jgi:hypothetical protein
MRDTTYRVQGGRIEHGILLGALGGLLGFFVYGQVHYNWGDSEVIMIFYFIMGLVFAIFQGHQTELGH